MTALKTAIFEKWQEIPDRYDLQEANPLNKDSIAMCGSRRAVIPNAKAE